MLVAVNQPYWFPYIGYFQLIQAVDKFIIYDDVNFIKGGWINRNRVLVDAEPRLLTVPTLNASSFKPIYQVHIDEARPWRKKMLRTLRSAYHRAPHFDTVYALFEQVVTAPELEDVSAMALASIEAVSRYLNIETSIVKTSRIYDNIELGRTERLIDICRREGATSYYNAIGGQSLYKKEDFLHQGIELHFWRAHLRPYAQGNFPFVSGLSILDVLMFNDVEEVRQMLREGEAV